MNRKTSKIWTSSKDELVKVVGESKTIAEILRRLGFKVFTASTYRGIQSRIKQEGIDYSHIPLGLGTNRNRSMNELSKEEVLDKWFKKTEFVWSNCNRIRYLKKFNLIPYECQKCKNQGEWQGIKLNLQLDHINGIREDNRLENLRFLCPNCHSQTNTFSGRNAK